MAQTSGFFNAVKEGDVYDRVYLAEDFADAMSSFIDTGVLDRANDDLKVNAQAIADMTVAVNPGRAWLNGYWYHNSEIENLTINPPDGVLGRIDAIVVRWSDVDRETKLVVVEGTAASTPVKPTPTRDINNWDIILAYITLQKNSTTITSDMIEDTRNDDTVCGMIANANLIGPLSDNDVDEATPLT